MLGELRSPKTPPTFILTVIWDFSFGTTFIKGCKSVHSVYHSYLDYLIYIFDVYRHFVYYIPWISCKLPNNYSIF